MILHQGTLKPVQSTEIQKFLLRRTNECSKIQPDLHVWIAASSK